MQNAEEFGVEIFFCHLKLLKHAFIQQIVNALLVTGFLQVKPILENYEIRKHFSGILTKLQKLVEKYSRSWKK